MGHSLMGLERAMNCLQAQQALTTKSAKSDEKIWSFAHSGDDTPDSVTAICESAQIISLGKPSDTKKTCYRDSFL